MKYYLKGMKLGALVLFLAIALQTVMAAPTTSLSLISSPYGLNYEQEDLILSANTAHSNNVLYFGELFLDGQVQNQELDWTETLSDEETGLPAEDIFMGPDGNLQTGPGTNNYQAEDIVIDSEGNIYITGWVFKDSSNQEDFVTVKYDSNMDVQWVELFESPGGGHDKAYGIAVDEDGNVYVTGYITHQFERIYTIKYDTNGNKLWEKAHSNGWGNDAGHDIAVDTEGNAYVVGDRKST